MKQRIITASAAAALALVTAACGGGEKAGGSGGAEQAKPTLTASKTGLVPVEGDDTVAVAALVSNPSSQQWGTKVTWKVLDAAGTEVGSLSAMGVNIRPEEETAISSFLPVQAGAKPTKVTVQIEPTSILATTTPVEPGAAITGSEATVVTENGRQKLRGSFASTFTKSYSSTSVTGVCTDAAGAIVGIVDEAVDSLPGKKTTAFTSNGLTLTGTPKTCRLYAHPSEA